MRWDRVFEYGLKDSGERDTLFYFLNKTIINFHIPPRPYNCVGLWGAGFAPRGVRETICCGEIYLLSIVCLFLLTTHRERFMMPGCWEKCKINKPDLFRGERWSILFNVCILICLLVQDVWDEHITCIVLFIRNHMCVCEKREMKKVVSKVLQLFVGRCSSFHNILEKLEENIIILKKCIYKVCPLGAPT